MGIFDWILRKKQLKKMSADEPSVEKPKEMKQTEKKHSFRWYFLSVGHAMGERVFESLCSDEEFSSFSPGEAVPQGKVMVRYYSSTPSTAKNRVQKAGNLGLTFQGHSFPLIATKPAKEIVDLTAACSALFGVNDLPDLPVMVVLTDSRFDKVMRGYCELLNQQYIKSGGLPIVNLMYTDDVKSAQNLISLFSLKRTVDRFEEKFMDWCMTHSIDPKSFIRVSKKVDHKQDTSESPPISFKDIESLGKMIVERHSLVNEKHCGIIDDETFVDILRQVENHVSIYICLSSAVAFKSVLRVAVFPKDQFGSKNIEFLGLGVFNLGDSVSKYLQWYSLSPEDIGLAKGQIMSRLLFEKPSQRLSDKQENYELVSVDNLRKRITKRQAELGLK